MHSSLVLNGRPVLFSEIREGKVAPVTEFEAATLGFCRQWLNGQATFSLKTSGSTGTPKTIDVSRRQILASAQQTIKFFNLRSTETVLVCLNTAYIAGIMMLVRGLESGAKIIITEPLGNPLLNITEPVDFLAIVPLQLNNILEEPSSLLQLESIRATIVGGAPVSSQLMKKISSTKAAVWATFGMTETLTHFAVRQLNPVHEKAFTTLDHTSISLDDRGCLVVQSTVTKNKPIISNDLAEIHDPQSFTWLGRIDNVINTGGVKLQIESLEDKFAKFMTRRNLDINYFISALPDERLNEKVCLLIEADQEIEGISSPSMDHYFDKYEQPKKIIYLPRFVYTPTGKINRPATLQLIDLLG